MAANRRYYMKFVLFEKLSELEGLELYMLIGALALVVIFAAAMLIFKLKPSPKSDRLGSVMSALLTAALAFAVYNGDTRSRHVCDQRLRGVCRFGGVCRRVLRKAQPKP